MAVHQLNRAADDRGPCVVNARLGVTQSGADCVQHDFVFVCVEVAHTPVTKQISSINISLHQDKCEMMRTTLQRVHTAY
jgi:hypothetical protein